MKAKGLHEGCIEQIQRLYQEHLFNGGAVPVDAKGRVRVDDLEMRDDVQSEVTALWAKATTETLPTIGDLKGYSTDFFNLFGFEVPGVDYEADTNELVEIPGLQG